MQSELPKKKKEKKPALIYVRPLSQQNEICKNLVSWLTSFAACQIIPVFNI